MRLKSTNRSRKNFTGDPPKVSVLVITYKHERFIAQALNSILMQRTSFPFEVVVADDCSPDCTRAVLRRYQRLSGRTITVHRQEQNVGMCLNFASSFPLCRGEFVALLEGDDFWTDPDKLQTQTDYLDANQQCSLCFHQVRVLDATSTTNLIFPETAPPILRTEDLIEANPMATGSVMFRRDALKELPLWCANLKMLDWPMFILLSREGDVGFIEKIMGVYRLHANGVWSQTPQRQRSIDIIAALEEIEKHLEPCYSPRIHRRIAEAYAHVAWCEEQNNQLAAAIRSSFHAVLADPSGDPKHKRNLVRLFLKATAPEIYLALQRHKPVVTGP